MPLGLNDHEAAKIVGCSHVAVGNARRGRRIPTLPDGSISHDELLKWNKGRRAPRGGNHRKVTGDTPVVTIPLKSMVGPAVTAATNAEAALALLNSEGVFADRADAERYRDSYVARLRQIEYEEKSGKLIATDAVNERIVSACSRVRTRLLAIPSEQAPAIHRLKTVAEVEAMLRRAIVEALEELVISLRKTS